MALRLTCPCGEQVFGRDEGELLSRATLHLEAEHSGRSYSDEEILMMAVPVPERLLPLSGDD